MRTWKIMIKPDKDAVLCRYFKENTTAAKCMYNAANFYIRNTMTGIRKSPEERTAHETEVLHYVLLGFRKQMLIAMKYTVKNGRDTKRLAVWLVLLRCQS